MDTEEQLLENQLSTIAVEIIVAGEMQYREHQVALKRTNGMQRDRCSYKARAPPRSSATLSKRVHTKTENAASTALPEDVSARPQLRTRTLPEQLADHLAIAILNGEYQDDEHASEQRIAGKFGVSHGPVREAFRALSKRGLIEFRPGRGAFVIAVTLDAVADIFNIRAVLLGLAVHSLAMLPDERRQARQLRDRLAAVQMLASDKKTDPILFGQAIGRVGNVIYHACDNAHLKLLLHEEATGSIWRHLWRERALDFVTQPRRDKVLADWTRLVDTIVVGQASRASTLMRDILFDSRDEALATLQRTRSEKVGSSRYIRD